MSSPHCDSDDAKPSKKRKLGKNAPEVKDKKPRVPRNPTPFTLLNAEPTQILPKLKSLNRHSAAELISMFQKLPPKKPSDFALKTDISFESGMSLLLTTLSIPLGCLMSDDLLSVSKGEFTRNELAKKAKDEAKSSVMKLKEQTTLEKERIRAEAQRIKKKLAETKKAIKEAKKQKGLEIESSSPSSNSESNSSSDNEKQKQKSKKSKTKLESKSKNEPNTKIAATKSTKKTSTKTRHKSNSELKRPKTPLSGEVSSDSETIKKTGKSSPKKCGRKKKKEIEN